MNETLITHEPLVYVLDYRNGVFEREIKNMLGVEEKRREEKRRTREKRLTN